MSNLLTHPYGQIALREAVIDQVRERIKRWFQRNTVIAIDDWIESDKLDDFNFTTVLGQLNAEHDQEILDLLQLLSNLQAGYAEINADFYIDTVNGDDVEGLGTAAAPFATLVRVQRILPDYLTSFINIFVSAPTGNPINYMYDWNMRFNPGAQITIQGTDTPIVDAGPYAIQAWNDVVGAQTYAHGLSVAGAPWLSGQWIGHWIHILDGAAAGNYYAILSNSISILGVPFASVAPAPGDNFEIVSPGTQFNLPAQYFRAELESPSQQAVSRVVFSNINFNTTVPEFRGTCDLWLPLCYFPDISIAGNEITINENLPYDPTEIVDVGLRSAATPLFFTEELNSYCFSWKVRHSTILQIYNRSGGEGTITQVGFNNITSQNGSKNKIDQCYAESLGINSIELQHNEYCNIDGLWVNFANSGVNLNGGHLYTTDYEGVPAQILNYGVVIGPGSFYDFDGTPVSGTTNDIQWRSTAAAVAYPAVAGTSVTDGNGAYAVKLS